MDTIESRYLGSYPHTTGEGDDARTFFSHAFALTKAKGVFSVTSNGDRFTEAGIEAGAVFNVRGLSLEPALDKDGVPMATKRGEPVLNATRVADVDFALVRNGGFTITKAPPAGAEQA